MRASNLFLDRVLTVMESDLVVASQFLRVTAMIDPPSRLLRPSNLLRIMRARHREQTTIQPAIKRTRETLPESRQDVPVRSA
ncbi:hypothetical protein MBOU_31150 [Mycobacterium bourgelatii]|uniref:Uncharacterized protein n=1 Tax=Mycobacterium bourgelatii TaxID=1273442 RepID=A0A7I9YRD5_MYCBU|nr:hypothetical protein MBOU_31150 [Mycobacterium bourgelatii]